MYLFKTKILRFNINMSTIKELRTAIMKTLKLKYLFQI